MTPVRIPVEVGSDEWLAERRKGIGASEIPVVLGLSPWGSPYELFYQKRGVVDGEFDNEAMEMGRDLEEVILRRFAREHPDMLVFPGALYHHPDRPWQLSTPDGIACRKEHRCGIQAKAAARWEHWGDEGTDDVPVYYRAQTIWEMDVMGWDHVHIPVLVPPFSYREYVVRYDADEAELMRKYAIEFLERITANDPPDIDDRPATTRALKQMHPDAGEGGVDIPATLHRQWQIAARLSDLAGKRKTLAENRIRHHLGDHNHALVDGQPVANKVVYSRRTVDSRALKAAGLYDRYTRTTTVNSLRVKRTKDTNHGK